ncbi:MAG TPA: hypothetical protein VFF06_23775 [Polyangia bacterium]|nr:hypothetical protein [Polyangia bacterium]
MRGALLATLAALALASSSCVGDYPFTCNDTHTCGFQGVCVNGGCAFPASDCPSGLRYDKSASGSNGACVANGLMLDLSMNIDFSGVDLTGVDFTMKPLDLSGCSPNCPDIATPPDLTPPQDLTPPTDLIPPCTPSGAENCFDGIDNDCNGATDCADTACTPIAECVQADPGAQIGAEVALGGPCPTHYGGTAVPLHQGLNAPLTCSGCACTPSITCGTTVTEWTAAACPGTATATFSPDDASCLPATLNTTNYTVAAMTPTTRCLPTGSPSVPAATWTTSTQFCPTTQIGAGCPAGNICVAKAAKHCTLDAANASCMGNYAPELGGQWFGDFSDTRSCGASCSCGAPAGGTCGSGAVVKGFSNSAACSGAFFNMAASSNVCGLSSALQSLTVNAPNKVGPSCSVGNTVSGNAGGINQQTLCCL